MAWACQPYAPAASPLPPGRSLVLISVRGWVDPRVIVKLKALSQLKKKITTSGIEPATIRLVAFSTSVTKNGLHGVRLGKPTAAHTRAKFPTLYRNFRFITWFRRARHWSLPWARWIQLIQPHTSYQISILIVSSRLCLGLANSLFPSGFPRKTVYAILFRLSYIPWPCYLPLLDNFIYYLSRITSGEAPHYVVLSTLLLCHS
jgi:hypothetical protein